MERLWAPWRMRYIGKNKKNRETAGGCLLCESLELKDDRKAYILHRGRHCFVVLNIYPYNSGHLLIVPYAHVPDLEGLDRDSQMELMALVQDSVRIIRQEMNPQGFNIGINIGAPAGAGIPDHLHVQLVPRWTGDTSSITVFDRTRVLPELLEETYERLRPHFEKVSS